MNFSDALIRIKEGYYLTRKGWNGNNMKVSIKGWESTNKRPYIQMELSDASLIPWLPSQTDLLADDWETV